MTGPLPITVDPLSLIKPRRKITGISAVLLPFARPREVDWPAFRAHLRRTVDAGLIPAVNMDTGYIPLLDESARLQVLRQTREELADTPFFAGAFVNDHRGDRFAEETYCRRIDEIQRHGGTPVIFQSFGLVEQSPEEIVVSYQRLAGHCDRFLAFELTQQLAPFGAVYDLQTFSGLMEIPQCAGAKHSSFRREPEWQRLALRDRQRPDFAVYTGNDLAIDMVMYGSDYLLGLSTFAPAEFARRDRFWEQGNARFFEYNDALQYLGMFSFRPPAAAYKHSAAQFLKLRGWIDCDQPHPGNPRRPDGDVTILREIVRGMTALA